MNSWLYISTAQADTAQFYAASVFEACYGQISASLPPVYGPCWPDKFFQAMYPALILIIVNRERSIVDTFGFSTVLGNNEGHANSAEHRPATIGHLVFANPPTKSTVDGEQSLSPRHSTVPVGLGSGDSSLA
jgi:hypothetical protein